MTLADLDADARAVGLALRGAFHPTTADDAPDGARTLVMLGPDEPRFWKTCRASSEMRDGAPHPLDRWSKRVVAGLADAWHGTAVFPYDGPPYAPFLRWAERTGACWPSPVGLLVHEDAGLFISFRAALAVPVALDLDTAGSSPCLTCATRPCETACPVGALTVGAPYDVPACIAHLESAEGVDCRSGCLVRRACPTSQRFGRMPEQSAFHMRAFLGQ